MKVGGLILFACAYLLTACASTVEREVVPVRADAVELASLTPILQAIPLGDGLAAEIRAARGPGGVVMTLHLPVVELFNGRHVQTILFEAGSLPERLYLVDLDGEAPAELAIDQGHGGLNDWIVVSAQSSNRGPAYWHRHYVPEALIDLDALGAELLLEFDPADYR